MGVELVLMPGGDLGLADVGEVRDRRPGPLAAKSEAGFVLLPAGPTRKIRANADFLAFGGGGAKNKPYRVTDGGVETVYAEVRMYGAVRLVAADRPRSDGCPGKSGVVWLETDGPLWVRA